MGVSMGYWPDPFLPHMTRQACRDRRAPEIHLGYFARVAGVRMLIDKFFEACDTAVQVINLGAGFDTTFWRLLEEGRPVKNFIEIDFAGVSARKCHLIKSRKELMGLVAGEEADIKLSKTELHSTRYHLVSADFTDLPVLESKLAESEVSFSCPTLILAECALVYVDQAKTSRMMSWLAAKFSSCTFVNYEQLNMNDRLTCNSEDLGINSLVQVWPGNAGQPDVQGLHVGRGGCVQGQGHPGQQIHTEWVG